jgi:hypothetical protein
VDYRNNFFTSSDTEKTIEFYDQFENRDQLIKWMKERPKGASYIHEVTGNKDIIVVVTTADFKGKHAKACRDEVFKGLHMIFVESGGREDFYFNYAHNCNIGIRKALEYNPKWIVISNDDVVNGSSVQALVSELLMLEDKKINIAFVKNDKQTSTVSSIKTLNILGKFILQVFIKTHLGKNLKTNYKVSLLTYNLNKKFKNKYSVMQDRLVSNIFYRRLYTFYNFEALGIFSSAFVKSNLPIFDDKFINAHEDQYLSIKLSTNPDKIRWIRWSVKGLGGFSLGNGIDRGLRTFASEVYFNYKLEQEKIVTLKGS